MSKFVPGPWEFENRPNQHDPSQAYAAVVDAEGRVIFDTANVDVRLAEVWSDPDEHGNVWHQAGPAIESLKLAAQAPALIAFVRRYFDETACICKFDQIQAAMGTNVRCTHCQAGRLITAADPGVKV